MHLPNWLGFRGKTLWDWLQLLIVPAILIAVTFAWSATQTRSDNKREDRGITADNKREDRRIAADRAAAKEARQDATLQTYLDQMSGLMLSEKLLTSKEGSAVRAVARTVALTTLRRLNGSRKGEVVRFLQEAGLINANLGSRVRLEGADLTGADLTGANLVLADFRGANLKGANLTRADLAEAHLTQADLRSADLHQPMWVEVSLDGLAGLDGCGRTALEDGAERAGAAVQDPLGLVATADRARNPCRGLAVVERLAGHPR